MINNLGTPTTEKQSIISKFLIRLAFSTVQFLVK